MHIPQQALWTREGGEHNSSRTQEFRVTQEAFASTTIFWRFFLQQFTNQLHDPVFPLHNTNKYKYEGNA